LKNNDQVYSFKSRHNYKQPQRQTDSRQIDSTVRKMTKMIYLAVLTRNQSLLDERADRTPTVKLLPTGTF